MKQLWRRYHCSGKRLKMSHSWWSCDLLLCNKSIHTLAAWSNTHFIISLDRLHLEFMRDSVRWFLCSCAIGQGSSGYSVGRWVERRVQCGFMHTSGTWAGMSSAGARAQSAWPASPVLWSQVTELLTWLCALWRKYSKKQEMEPASFLRAGPSSWYSIISAFSRQRDIGKWPLLPTLNVLIGGESKNL